jgi:adenine-specific DNA-methyltransferase
MTKQSGAQPMGSKPAAGLVDDFLRGVEARRLSTQAMLKNTSRAGLGQFFTPMAAATFIASLPVLASGNGLRILDPGAGTGSLTAAMVVRLLNELPGVAIDIVAVEVDPTVAVQLAVTLEECVRLGERCGSVVTTQLVNDDFLNCIGDMLPPTAPLGSFDIVLMNPPYRKLARSERDRLAVAGFDSNHAPVLR